MIDVGETLLVQFANSPTIVALTNALAEYFDLDKVEDDFFDKIYNIDTAEGKGLDIWGLRLGVSRYLKIPFEEEYFGFFEADYSPFDDAPFYSGQDAALETVELSDSSYRKLLLAKALANISNCSVPSLNSMLRALFAGEKTFYGDFTGTPIGSFVIGVSPLPGYQVTTAYSDSCYVTRPETMHIRFVFEFSLTDLEWAIVTQSGVLPIPTGVYADAIDRIDEFFGFYEANMQPFGQGVFFNGEVNEIS